MNVHLAFILNLLFAGITIGNLACMNEFYRGHVLGPYIIIWFLNLLLLCYQMLFVILGFRQILFRKSRNG